MNLNNCHKQYSIDNISDFNSGLYDIQILENYFNISVLPILICNPLRNDKHSSMGLQLYNDQVLYKDFATADSGNIRTLLSKMWNIPYKDTIERIAKELNCEHETYKVQTSTGYYTINGSHVDIKVKIKEFTKEGLDYWNTYGISKDWLNFANVFQLDYYTIQNITKKADNTTFCYAYKKNDNSFQYKIYQPTKSKDLKWRSNVTKDTINLYNKIPKTGTYLIIASSMKDSLCIWANTGIPSISFQSETENLDLNIINDIKNRFKYIFILYDNDETGLQKGEEFSKQYDLINLVLPKFEGGKDISDFYKVYGRVSFINLIKELIQCKNKRIHKTKM